MIKKFNRIIEIRKNGEVIATIQVNRNDSICDIQPRSNGLFEQYQGRQASLEFISSLEYNLLHA